MKASVPGTVDILHTSWLGVWEDVNLNQQWGKDLEYQKCLSNKSFSYIHMFWQEGTGTHSKCKHDIEKNLIISTVVEDKPLLFPSASQYLMSAEILHYTWRLNPSWSQWKWRKKAKNVKQTCDSTLSVVAWKICSCSWIMHAACFPLQNNKLSNEKFERSCNLPGWREHKIGICWLMISQKGFGVGNPQFKLQPLFIYRYIWLHSYLVTWRTLPTWEVT